MMVRLAALATIALAACAKKEEAPAAAPAAAAAPEAAPRADEAPAAEETVMAKAEDAAAPCPVLDSRNWTAWTAPDGDGHRLTVAGEVDMPTPGYAISWRDGPADRAMPPGLRLHLDAAAPADLVMQVVTPTPVSYSTKADGARYRVVTVLCGGEAIAEIAEVGPKT